MTHGNSRARAREQRRNHFHGQASHGGNAPPPMAPPRGIAGIPGARGQVVAPAPAVGTPTQVFPSSMPPGQIQPHQVRHTSGLPGSQPDRGQPTFAPQSGQIVPVTPGPRPATAVPPRLPSSSVPAQPRDRKSTRLNSSHSSTSYAVSCLKKKKQHLTQI